MSFGETAYIYYFSQRIKNGNTNKADSWTQSIDTNLFFRTYVTHRSSKYPTNGANIQQINEDEPFPASSGMWESSEAYLCVDLGDSRSHSKTLFLKT